MQPDVLVLAALVALPVVFLVAAAAVEELVLLGDEADEDAAIERQADRRAALDPDAVEVGVAADDVLEHGPEDDLAPVRRPGDDLGPAGIMGQPDGGPALDGHQVDGLGAVVGRREGDPLPVGRELGEALGPREGRQARGHAALGAHRPEVGLVGEDDRVVVDGRVGEEPARLGREHGGAQKANRQQGSQDVFHRFLLARRADPPRRDSSRLRVPAGQIKPARMGSNLHFSRKVEKWRFDPIFRSPRACGRRGGTCRGRRRSGRASGRR
ncbi:MAG: hypothetical protein H6P95_870 [Candidatus Aminicenantes bacterium]|nr:hypothetical protein [Candidatus Aminicenantes bacterium]